MGAGRSTSPSNSVFDHGMLSRIESYRRGDFPNKYADWFNDNNNVHYSRLRVCIMGATLAVPPELIANLGGLAVDIGAASVSGTAGLVSAVVARHGHAVLNGAVATASVICAALAAGTAGIGNARVGFAVFRDLLTVDEYFRSTGAQIDHLSYGETMRTESTIVEFLREDGNNKAIYFSGHGGPRSMCLSKSKGIRYSPDNFLQDIVDAKFCGTLTLIVDCCHAGSWAAPVAKAAADLSHPLHELDKLMINLRMACREGETTAGPEQGSKFTGAWLLELMSEPGASGEGTRILRRQDPRCAFVQQIWAEMTEEWNSAPCQADFLFGISRTCNPVTGGKYAWYSSNLESTIGPIIG